MSATEAPKGTSLSVANRHKSILAFAQSKCSLVWVVEVLAFMKFQGMVLFGLDTRRAGEHSGTVFRAVASQQVGCGLDSKPGLSDFGSEVNS